MKLIKGLKSSKWIYPLIHAVVNSLKWCVLIIMHGCVRNHFSYKVKSKHSASSNINSKTNSPTRKTKSNITRKVKEPASSWVSNSFQMPNRKVPFYSRDVSLERDETIKVMKESTKEDFFKIDLHVFMLLESVSSFKSSLSRMQKSFDIVNNTLRMDILDTELFVSTPVWTVRLSCLVLEETDHLFSMQFPLSLLYEISIPKRDVMESLHKHDIILRKKLKSRYLKIEMLNCTSFGLNHSCTKRSINKYH
jgi:hypothetical protein